MAPRKPGPGKHTALLTGLVVVVAMVLSAVQGSAASPLFQSAPSCPAGQQPAFVLGFASLKSQIGPAMGDPLECVRYDAAGNAQQATTTGMAFYRRSTNIPTFAAGDQHWAWTTLGLIKWTGTLVDPPDDLLGAPPALDRQEVDKQSQQMVDDGRRVYRYDTFGDEAFWGDALQLHKAIAGEKQGGVGPGVSPKTALAVGLKVDTDALPQALVDQLKAGEVDLDDPTTTLALIKLNAVVGVKGFFSEQGALRSMGITCALCHSTVDDSFAPGIGTRLDGWANRDLNVGAIVSLAPNLTPIADRLGVDVDTVKKVLASWGPGKYDAELSVDGKAFRPDGKTAATLLPPAFGLSGVNLHTYTAWGSVPYWNAYVAITQMHGQGIFYDPRLNDPVKFPLAVKNGDWNIRPVEDLVSAKLPALHLYQVSIPAPTPPAGSFDQVAAVRGEALFSGKARCANCHVPPRFTEPGFSVHSGAEIGIDDFQSSRSPTNAYRTTPLNGLWTHMKGGFYHDGRYATLRDVVNHYNDFFKLGLSEQESLDLVEYLKSL